MRVARASEDKGSSSDARATFGSRLRISRSHAHGPPLASVAIFFMFFPMELREKETARSICTDQVIDTSSGIRTQWSKASILSVLVATVLCALRVPDSSLLRKQHLLVSSLRALILACCHFNVSYQLYF